jgi:hypothetical protein
VYDGTCVMFRTMRDVGFSNRVRHTSAFCQLLAMSSWHLAHLNQRHKMTEHLGYSLIATQELQKQVDDWKEGITDDAISAVLAFACCAVSDQCDLHALFS